MLLSLLNQPYEFVMWILAIVYVLTVHEFAHAWAAYKQGDSTAMDNGRLTLNPLAHLDIFGFLSLLLIGFGWGKPVPFNPANLRNRKLGTVLIAVAGPFANLLSVIIFGLIIRFFLGIDSGHNLLTQFFYILTRLNAVILIFNLIPVPPLDGSKLLLALLPERAYRLRFYLEHHGPTILLILILSNILLNISIFGWLFVLANRIVNLLVGA
ncbi:MAG: site-2 protease family protein [Patescibacteria group bacterium]